LTTPYAIRHLRPPIPEFALRHRDSAPQLVLPANPQPAPGQSSQDSPDTAVACRERNVIQRRHRTERRAGQEPSVTPSINTIRRRNVGIGPDEPIQSSGTVIGAPDDGDDSYFICNACGLARALNMIDAQTGFCFYCVNPAYRTVPDNEPKVCIRCLSRRCRRRHNRHHLV